MAIDLGNDPGGTPPTAGEKLQIRSAIGVGTTDAPTFAGLTSTGEIVGRSGSYGTPTLRGGAGNAYQWISASALGVVTGGGITTFQTGTNAGVSYIAVGDDITLYRDAAGILAQRNGTNAQAFRVYNTYAAGTNDEYGAVAWIGGVFEVGSKAVGTGATRHTRISSANTVVLNTGGIDRWRLSAAGNLTADADNTYDIGASGANRPRNIYVAGQVNVQGQSFFNGVNLSAGGGSVRLQSAAYGVMTVLDSDGTGNFNRMQLGGTTSAFPAIKRNGTGIDIVYANDSGYAPLTAGIITAAGGFSAAGLGFGSLTSGFFYWASSTAMSAPSDGVMKIANSAGTSFTRLELGTANLGISRGTGSPEGVVTALVGSLYIRTDGGASTTLYVKESSPTPSTGWVAK